MTNWREHIERFFEREGIQHTSERRNIIENPVFTRSEEPTYGTNYQPITTNIDSQQYIGRVSNHYPREGHIHMAISGDIFDFPPDSLSQEEREKQDYENSKERFIEMLKAHSDTLQQCLEQEIIQVRQNLTDYESQTNQYRWQLNDLLNQQKRAEEVKSGEVDHYGTSFDSLLRHDKVEAVGLRANNQQLVIKTVELTMTHPNTSEEKVLGQFELEVPIGDRYNRVRAYNRTNAKERDGEIWHHPHIGESGGPCFGAIEPQIIDSLSNGEFLGAFELMLVFLQTFNPDDSYGHHWSMWE